MTVEIKNFWRYVKRKFFHENFKKGILKFYKKWLKFNRPLQDIRKSQFIHSRLGKVFCSV